MGLVVVHDFPPFKMSELVEIYGPTFSGDKFLQFVLATVP